MKSKNKGKVTKYFLGANSPVGFYSLYDSFVNFSEGDFLWTIKGGPGCGKSSFMRYIGAAAEDMGLDVEYIHCSGDPDSLDGVYIPSKHVAYVDGTAPHITEAQYPGAASLYLDLGRFYDREALKSKLKEIIDVNTKYKGLYAAAYSAIAASDAVNPRAVSKTIGKSERKAIRRRALGAAIREFSGIKKEGGDVKYRMLSAFTCQGKVFYSETVTTLCKRIYALDNEYGFAEIYLREIENEAYKRGLDVLICPDPMDPKTLEAVILPKLSLGFIARSEEELGVKAHRHIRLDAMSDREVMRKKRAKVRTRAKFRDAILADAGESLAEAKALHDDLEAIYNPYVDFKGVYELADEHIKMLK